MQNEKRRKIQLVYPCPWVYKIIGPDAEEMRRAVAEIIRDRSYNISHSRSSAGDKYHCLNLELLVESESHRTILFEALQAHQSIKIIL